MVFQKQLRYLLRPGVLIICAPLVLFSQQQIQPPHTVRASAESVVTAKPDRAEIAVSVYSQAATSEEASQQNARATSQLLAAVKQVIGSKGEIKTSGYVATPQMQYPKNGGTPKITGYAVNNRIRITIDDLALVSKTIDGAIAAGASRVEGVNFELKDDQAVRGRALTEASRKAYANAEAIAKALNLNVVGVLEAQTGTEAPPPMPRFFSTAQSVTAGQEPTPIEPGDIDVHTTVTVTLEVR
jgi:uncharacterized protein YggE